MKIQWVRWNYPSSYAFEDREATPFRGSRNKKNDPGSRSWRGQATYPIAWTSFGPLRPDVLRTSIVCASRGDSVNSLES